MPIALAGAIARAGPFEHLVQGRVGAGQPLLPRPPARASNRLVAMTSSLEEVRRLAAAESGLAVAVTVRPDGTPHASVVNGG